MKNIYLAGINNSGPGHWQNFWFQRLGGVWVGHQDWDNPKAGDWIEDLERTLKDNPGPKVLMAHSLGCLIASQWAVDHRDQGVKGAFLVAPPNIQSPGFPKEAEGFMSPFAGSFPFASMIVASRNDPYSSLEYANRLAVQWGSRLIDVGEKGHINLKSNLGFWEEGYNLFQIFCGSIR